MAVVAVVAVVAVRAVGGEQWASRKILAAWTVNVKQKARRRVEEPM